MTKKPKLSKDAFEWVKPTTPETKPAAPAETKKTSAPLKRSGRAPAKKERKILVKYKKRNGAIAAILEISEEQPGIMANPFIIVPEDDGMEEFVLPGELLNKELIEIHANYKVDTAGKAPKLVAIR